MAPRRNLPIAVLCVLATAYCNFHPFSDSSCTNRLPGLGVQPAFDTISVGQSVILLSEGEDIFGSPACSYSWTSSDSLVVSLQSAGAGFGPADIKALGRAHGSATVSVSAGGKTASSTIIVQ